MGILLVFVSHLYDVASDSNSGDFTEEGTQGAHALPEGLPAPFEGAGTHLQNVSTPPQSAIPILQGTCTSLQEASPPPPRQGASSLVPVANTTPQGASTRLPLVASSPIVAQLTATRSPSFLTVKSRTVEELL